MTGVNMTRSDPLGAGLRGPHTCALPGTVTFISHAACRARRGLVAKMLLSRLCRLHWPMEVAAGLSTPDVVRGWKLCITCPSWRMPDLAVRPTVEYGDRGG